MSPQINCHLPSVPICKVSNILTSSLMVSSGWYMMISRYIEIYHCYIDVWFIRGQVQQVAEMTGTGNANG